MLFISFLVGMKLASSKKSSKEKIILVIIDLYIAKKFAKFSKIAEKFVCTNNTITC
tara:strand:- start:680 stop:847 length:168 start_codon:yes stop_codon:yes gene_type:complete